MVKLSFSTLGSPNYSVEQVIALATQNGYDGVELRTIRGTNEIVNLAEFGPDEILNTAQKFADAGLAISCLDTSINITTGTGPEFTNNLEQAKVYATLAKKLGAPFIRIFAGPDDEDPEPTASFSDIAHGLSVLADEVHDLGVMAVIETHGTLSKSASLIELFSHGVGDKIGVLWDVVHTYRNGESVAESFTALQSHIKHVHLKDAAGMIPTDDDYVLTGEGIIPIFEVMSILADANYQGFVSFEWEKFWVPTLLEPEVAIPQFATYMANISE